jgi:hypothetical protein
VDAPWSKLSPTEFERLCYLLLEVNDFTGLSWYGKSGADKGRDILATKSIEPLAGVKRHETWVIQCKRYIDKQPTKNELGAFLQSCREHKPSSVLLIFTLTLRASLKDWLKAVQDEYNFSIYLWEEEDLRRELDLHRSRIREKFPQLYETGNTIVFYRSVPNEVRIMCSEFLEVDFVAWNVSNYKEAREKVIEFIEFIKENDIVLEEK